MNRVILHLKHYLSLYSILLLFLALQTYRVFYLAPPPEYIWDNIYLWDWARNFSELNFSTFVSDSHHQLRWGNWGFAAILIKLFSDDVLFYFLSTIIPSTLGIGLFLYYAWRYVGPVSALVFLVLWYFDALLFRATFQLLPSGAALLPCAVMLLLATKIATAQTINTAWVVLLSITMVWLYGTKETHLAFLPAVMLILFRAVGPKGLIILFSVLLLGYFVETHYFLKVGPDFTPLGRIAAVVDGGQHVTIMTESKNYVGQQTQYFDSGITMRWMASSGVTPVILFGVFVIALIVLAQASAKTQLNSTQAILAMFIASFFICTTFFVISVFPLRLGHGLVPRYVTILLPFAYLLAIAFIKNQLEGTPWGYKVAAIALLPFFLAPSIHRISNYPERSIFTIAESYRTFGKKLDRYECVRAKQRSIVMNQLDLVPIKYRGKHTIHMIGRDENTVYQNPWYISKAVLGKECQSMFTITRNTTMRY